MELQLDYLPKQDILGDPSLVYYDKYFLGLDEIIYNMTASAEQKNIIKFQKRKDSVVSRMLCSPFDISVYLESNNNDDDSNGEMNLLQEQFVTDVCSYYISRWCQWLEVNNAKVGSTNAATVDVNKKKEQCIQKLLFEDTKLHFAQHMGSSFAPKAADLAAAIVGPVL